MGNFFLDNILHLLPALLIALTIHEYSHGRMAYYLGDNTAKAHGRLTLNPLDHMDPIGLLMLAIAGFGWAKPVPVNPVNFRRDVPMRKGMLLVALAGPMSNLITAFIFLGVAEAYVRLVLGQTVGAYHPIFLLYSLTHPIIRWIVMLNIFLAIFNLIPVPPLDGSRILRAILPRNMEHIFYTLDQYGFVILILIIVTNVISMVMGPVATVVLTILHLPYQLILG